MKRRRPSRCIVPAAAAALALSGPARADEIIISGIPLPNVTVRGLDGCEVQYAMNGRAQSREVARSILHLDDVPALAQAEAEAARGDLARALSLLDEAATQAIKPWQRTWLHYRRTRLLDAAGRYTQACHAWATLLLTTTEPCWLEALPTCPPDRADKAVVEPALAQLRQARTEAGEDAVAVEVINAAIEAIDKAQRGEIAPAPIEAPAPRGEDESAAAPAGAPKARETPAAAGPAIADEIDRRLDGQQFAEARREIERLVAAPGTYPLDRLLFQYGRVLAAQGQTRDAVVRYMQCAILFAQGPHAASSLFEAARLYAGPLGDRAAARRLLDRAASIAAAIGESGLVERIDAALAELNSRR